MFYSRNWGPLVIDSASGVVSMRKANVYLTSQFFNKEKSGSTVGSGGRYILIKGPLHSYKGAAISVIMGPLALAALATSLGR